MKDTTIKNFLNGKFSDKDNFLPLQKILFEILVDRVYDEIPNIQTICI